MRSSISIILALILQIFSMPLVAQAQERILPDDNFSLTLLFHKTDTVLVVTPDSYILNDYDKRDIERYVFWDKWQKKPDYIYKKESELISADYSKKIQLYGPFSQFKNKQLINSPFKQTAFGFEFDKVKYEDPEDALFYISSDAKRLLTCRNSERHNNIYTQIGAGCYQLYVFRGNEIMVTGFEDNNTIHSVRYNNLELQRNRYFDSFSTQYLDFEISKGGVTDSLKRVLINDVDDYIKILCSHLEVGSDIKKLKTYVYSNMSDLQFFIAVPKSMTVYGKSIGNINHLYNFDITVFKHETAHSVIEEKIGKTENIFLLEGFATFTSYFFSSTAYSNDIQAVRDNLSLLNRDIIKGGSGEFYSNMAYYPISATFTKYLIDIIGLSQFKNVYLSKNIEESVMSITGKNLDQIIEDFKRDNNL